MTWEKDRVLCLLAIVLLWMSPAWAQYGGGQGREDDPYLLYTFEHLKTLAETTGDYDQCFKLMADIDWDPNETQLRIGTQYNNSFTGVFDGNGHIISGFTCQEDGYYVGLFGYIRNQGTVQDLGLVDASVSGYDYVGILSGYNYKGTIQRCFVTGSVQGDECVGGLVGRNYYGYVVWSYSHADVIGQRRVGGLIGSQGYSSTYSCFSTGTVEGVDQSSSYLGGFIGYRYSNVGAISGCFWDQEASGMEASQGGTGKTTIEMQTLSTFVRAGWSFCDADLNRAGVWVMPEQGGTPLLAWQCGIEADPPDLSDGTGSSDDPYVVTTAEQFVQIGRYLSLLDQSFVLAADIDLDGIEVLGIGNVVYPFEGQFNGQGYTISNVSLRVPDQNDAGLFNVIGEQGVVQGLRLEGVTVEGHEQVGALAGVNYGSVFQCCADGQVQGSELVGGLVGDNQGTVEQCYGGAAVNAQVGPAGGLVGSNDDTIRDCYCLGPVTSIQSGAGLVGANADTIETCYAAGAVDANEAAGLCMSDTGSVQNCCWDTRTTGQMTSAAGKGWPTQDLLLPETYIHWNEDAECVWTLDMGQDYPHLAWEQASGDAIPVYRISDFMDGMGMRSDPYLVADAVQLQVIGRFPEAWDCAFELTADINGIDTKDLDFSRIGLSEDEAFTGLFDGNGYCISHVAYQYVPRDNVGLFGWIGAEGEVRNLFLDHVVMQGADAVGALAGTHEGTLVNCHVSGEVYGDYCVGGLGGECLGVVMRCSSQGWVEGDRYVGGLVGMLETGEVSNCYSRVSVSGNRSVDGLVGDMDESLLTHSYATGEADETGSRRSVRTWYDSDSVVKHCHWNASLMWMRILSLYLDEGWDIAYETPDAESLWIIPDDPNAYPELNTTWNMDVNAPTFSGGEGTAGSPYLISTPDDLVSLAQSPGVMTCSFRMTNDIDMNGVDLGTIASQGVPFDGLFEGNGYCIENYTYDDPYTEYEGLFSYIGRQGRVRNLGLTDCQVTGGCDIGALAGVHLGTLQCCFTTGQVAAEEGVNGLVAWGGGEVNNSFSFVELEIVQDDEDDGDDEDDTDTSGDRGRR